MSTLLKIKVNYSDKELKAETSTLRDCVQLSVRDREQGGYVVITLDTDEMITLAHALLKEAL